jgi:hypothetical protein
MVRSIEAMEGTRTRQSGFLADPDPHGATSQPEGFSVDDDGNIRGASVGGRTVWKWVRS